MITVNVQGGSEQGKNRTKAIETKSQIGRRHLPVRPGRHAAESNLAKTSFRSSLGLNSLTSLVDEISKCPPLDIALPTYSTGNTSNLFIRLYLQPLPTTWSLKASRQAFVSDQHWLHGGFNCPRLQLERHLGLGGLNLANEMFRLASQADVKGSGVSEEHIWTTDDNTDCFVSGASASWEDPMLCDMSLAFSTMSPSTS